MVKALFDTNVLVDFLSSVPAAAEELGRYDDTAISIVTWMEVLVGAPPDQAAETERFLSTFGVVQLDTEVAREAVRLRRAHRVRLPDAVIWASARVSNRLLVTRNTRNFPVGDPGIREPYRL